MTTIGQQPNEAGAIHDYRDGDVLRPDDVQVPVTAAGGADPPKIVTPLDLAQAVEHSRAKPGRTPPWELRQTAGAVVACAEPSWPRRCVCPLVQHRRSHLTEVSNTELCWMHHCGFAYAAHRPCSSSEHVLDELPVTPNPLAVMVSCRRKYS